MLLNASQPFLPGGWGGGWGGGGGSGWLARRRRMAAVREHVGLEWGGGAADLKRWWKRAAGTGGEVRGVIRRARKVCCARSSNVLAFFAVCFHL